MITLGPGKLKWQKAQINQIERLNTPWKHACHQHKQEKDLNCTCPTEPDVFFLCPLKVIISANYEMGCMHRIEGIYLDTT